MILTHEGNTPDIEKANFVAPSADVIGRVVLEEGSCVLFGAVLRGDNNLIKIGKGTNIQDNTTLHTERNSEVILGENVTVGHNAVLHGCSVGSNSLIGMGAVVMDHAIIGENSIVGAGALVTHGKVFPAGSLIMGSPAKAVRQLTPEEIEGNKRSAEGYIKRSLEYKEALKMTNR